jgi:hypothetical protein
MDAGLQALAAFFAIEVLLFFASLCVYFYWRNNFPINKHTPAVVLLEIAVMGSLSIALIGPVLQEGHPILCFSPIFIYAILLHGAFSLVVIRMVLLWVKDFQTKLISDFHHLSSTEVKEISLNAKWTKKLRIWVFKRSKVILNPVLLASIIILEETEAVIEFAAAFRKVGGSGIYDIYRDAECYNVIRQVFRPVIVRYAIIAIIFALFYWRLLRIKENFGLVREMKSLLLVLVAFILFWVVYLSVPAVAFSNFFGNFWMGFILEVIWLTTSIWPTLFWTHKYKKQEKLHVTTERQLSHKSEEDLPGDGFIGKVSKRGILSKVLNDPHGHEIFRIYLEKEFALENILFWDAVEALRKIPVESKDFQQDCLELINKFISKESILCVNLSHKNRDDVLENFNCLNGDSSTQANAERLLQSIIKAEDEILMMLSLDSFTRFRLTPECMDLFDRWMTAQADAKEGATAI